eukprot:gnl/MRDRNA2_/MRDRNA2_15690_c0_seq1.p1 gnl/MRDRNA2_/MRDRNA2_15690_c0~~gnl/MRDRNA2_/MRDRNA2_15690_c0_seq1.p1  ORF type:complete len:448 (-),score=52.04 gnl/MRDRNA2_/MRDRNA2_15690_c0_seq1:47-1222(-)
MDLQAGYAGERVYVVVMMLVSILICSIFVSRVVVIGQRLGASKAELTERMRKVKEFMASRRVPHNLQTKVKRYLEYQHKAQISEPHESGFMDRLSPWLRLELTEHMNHGIVTRHPFFADLPGPMLKRICGAARTVLCAPGDVVVQRGHRASGTCYIVRGKLKILRAKKHKTGAKQSVYLESPSWIGDLCLFQDMERSNTVVSMTHSELLTISKDSLLCLLDEFPKARICYEEYRLRVSRGDLSAAGVRCNYCQSPGHFVGDCPEFRKQAAGKDDESNQKGIPIGEIGTWFSEVSRSAAQHLGLKSLLRNKEPARGRTKVVMGQSALAKLGHRLSGGLSDLGQKMTMKRRTGVSMLDVQPGARPAVAADAVVGQTVTEPFQSSQRELQQGHL